MPSGSGFIGSGLLVRDYGKKLRATYRYEYRFLACVLIAV